MELELLNAASDQTWLVDSVIKPELPQVIETLTRCLEMITSSTQPIKLALTSSRTEQAKGVITRIGDEIVDLDVTLSLNTFSKKLRLKMKPQCHLQLLQWTELIKLVNTALTDVVILQECEQFDEFFSQLNKVIVCLGKCNTAINNPHFDVLFPQHKMDLTTVFDSDGNLLEHYKDRLTMDFFLLNSEITLELKSLTTVTEEPWNEIDSQGNSHADRLRDDLKHHRIQLNDVLEHEKHGLFSQMFHKFTAHDYLTRAITFHDRVVIEVEKLSINCQDPVLLAVGAKLNGVEHLISKMYKNLDLVMMSLDQKK